MILRVAKLLQNLRVNLPYTLNLRYTSQFTYEMPEHIRNSFYLANSSCFDNANWFIQQAYEVVFNDLVDELKDRYPRLNTEEARKKVLDILKVLYPCNVVVDIHYPVKLKNGNVEVVRAYRAQHGKYKDDVPSLGGKMLLLIILILFCKYAVISVYKGTSILSMFFNAFFVFLYKSICKLAVHAQ